MDKVGKQIQILLIGQDVLVRAGIRMLVETSKALRVRAQGVADDAPALARRKKPDLILLDIDHCRRNCFELMHELHAHLPKAPIVAMTAASDETMLRKAYRFGASAVVLKLRPPETLISAIEKVAAGEIWIDKLVLPSLLEGKPEPAEKNGQGKIDGVTRRELDIVRLIGRGYRNKQIADALGISETTVRHHLSSIFGKLRVSDRLELLIYAHRNRLIDLVETAAHPHSACP
jgi:DNA-binding NarL/FixJ family response regulator